MRLSGSRRKLAWGRTIDRVAAVEPAGIEPDPERQENKYRDDFKITPYILNKLYLEADLCNKQHEGLMRPTAPFISASLTVTEYT